MKLGLSLLFFLASVGGAEAKANKVRRMCVFRIAKDVASVSYEPFAWCILAGL